MNEANRLKPSKIVDRLAKIYVCNLEFGISGLNLRSLGRRRPFFASNVELFFLKHFSPTAEAAALLSSASFR